MTDVTELLAEWRKLADEATPGPWDYYRPHPRYRSYVIERVTPAGHLSDDGVVTDAHVAGEIGDVFAGKLTGREDADQVTLYKSLGHVVQDLAAAAYLHARALREGTGS